jgi:hypothetical protein
VNVGDVATDKDYLTVLTTTRSEIIVPVTEALARHLSAIIARAKQMMAAVSEFSDLWELEAYLTESRKTVDRTYQFRYSSLLQVFSNLMRDGWLKEADLAAVPRGGFTKLFCNSLGSAGALSAER